MTDRLFSSRLVDTAAFIRSGGLVDDVQNSQTHSSAHEWLAKMNDAGLLTFDSQSGDDITERAYVSGIMPVDAARAFSEHMTITTDYVSMITRGVDPSTPWEAITVTRDQNPRGDMFSFTRLPLYMDHRSYAFEVRNALRVHEGISTDGYVIVSCFDPKWGRFAWNDENVGNDGGLYPSVVRSLTSSRV